MNTTDRRKFLAGAGAVSALAVSGLVGRAVYAAMGPQDKFDLVVKGGEVLDPSQNLRARRDVGIRFGVVEAVEADIPADRALRVLNASGKLVTPGLIDLHSHVFPYGSAIGIPADELVQFQGTSTLVSAGDAGANNFAVFRRHIVAQTRCRLYAFVHIANIGLAGFPVAELFNINYAQTDAAAKAVAENADMVIGVKVRMSENVIAKHGLEPLQRAIRACELVGHRRQGDVPHRRRADARADVADPRHAARRRHPDPQLLGLAERRRPGHEHRAGRQAAAGGARGEAPRRDLRRRPRRRQLRLHDGRSPRSSRARRRT